MAVDVLTDSDLEPIRQELARLRQIVASKTLAPADGGRNQGRGTYAWTQRRETAKMRAGWACQACGYKGALQVHHKLPRKDGGTDEFDNLIVLCPNHHAEAHAALRAAK